MTKKEIKKLRERTLKEIVKLALSTINGKDKLTNAERIYGQVLISQALQGDLKAIDMLTKLTGENEPEKMEISAAVGITHDAAIELIKKQING